MFPNQTMLPKPTLRAESVLNSIKAILSAGIRTRPPFWVESAKMALPSVALSAAARSRSISAAVASVSTTSSRGIDCIPILTSTILPLVGFALVGRARPAADAAPGESRDELLGGLLGDRAERDQPVPGADLRHAEEANGEQVGLIVRQSGVLPDYLADQVGAFLVGRVDLQKSGNIVEATTRGVAEFTLLLSPDALDFAQPIKVTANGKTIFEGRVEKSLATLMKWAARDNDRTMLFGAELHLKVR